MVDSVWYLLPNFDNTQDMDYPEGDKPETPIEDYPASVTDLSAVATGASSIQLSWSEVAGATNYNIQRSPDNLNWSDIGASQLPPFNSINLQSNTPYWFRVFSENANGWSILPSNTATDTTDEIVAPGTGDPIFYDDFERYTVGEKVVNQVPPIGVAGARWNWNSGSDVLVGDGGINGGKCLHFNFKSATDQSDNADIGHSYCEQQLRLCDSAGNAHQEIWVEFWLNTSNQARVKSSNDKFMAMHNVNYSTGGRAAYGRQAGLLNTWGGSNQRYGTLTFSNYYESGTIYDSWTHPYAGGGTPPYGPFGYVGNYDSWWNNYNHAANYNSAGQDVMAITPEQAGTWVRYRCNYKCNDQGLPNGHLRWWKGDELIQEVFEIRRDFLDNYERTDGLYLLGYFNAGFSAPTTWKIDEVSVYATDPNWSFT